METQVVIIGGGLMGTAIARELSRYKVDVILVEKYCDVSFGTTKSSHGMIYSGLNFLVSMLLKADALEASPEEEVGGRESTLLEHGLKGGDVTAGNLAVRGQVVVLGEDEGRFTHPLIGLIE